MNFVNIRYLHSKGMTIKRWLILQLIMQKDAEELRSLLKDDPKFFNWFEENKYIKFVKSPKDRFKAVRVDKKGKELLKRASIKDNSEEFEELCDSLIHEYEAMGKPTGTRLNVLDSIIWFCSVTPYTVDEVQEAVITYLSESDEYTKKLDNLFWTPPSKAFSVHRNLKDSLLYDLMNQL